MFPDDPKLSFKLFKEFLELHSGDVSEIDRQERVLIEAETYDSASKNRQNKNILSKGDRSVDIINKFVNDFSLKIAEKTGQLPSDELTQSLKNVAKFVVLTKYTKNIQWDSTNTFITNIEGLHLGSDGLFTFDAGDIKPSKNTRQVSIMGQEDSDDEETNQKRETDLEKFKKYLIKLNKKLSS